MFNRITSHHEVRRFTKFAIVGVANTIIDFSIYTLLIQVGHWPYLWANVVGFSVAAMNSYYFNRRWTFRSTASDVHREAMQYLIVIGSGFFLNEGGLYILVDHGHLHPLVAKVFVTGLVLIWNFGLNRLWTFRKATPRGLAVSPKDQ